MNPFPLCPCLLYYRFEEASPKVPNCVSIVDFEKDMQLLLELGYESISISDIVNAQKNKKPLPSNCFCIIFQGGYEDNYRIAYPVIQRLGIYVNIFIEPDMVGVRSSTDAPDFLPRFTWEEARQMCSSGLVGLYAFWHPLQNDKDYLCKEIERRINQLNINVKNNNAKTSFYINTTECEKERIEALKTVGVDSYLIAFWMMNAEKIEAGALPFICVNQGVNILDLFDEFNLKCSHMLKQEEDTFRTEDVYVTWNNTQYQTVELKIDRNPLVRNYLRHAFPLSVIAATRKDKAELFVLYEYINVIFRPWYHWFDYDNSLYDSWEIISCSKIPREIFATNNLSILDCIANGISAGYYCDLWLDVYYIPGKAGYNETHFTHNVLVYGYDKSANTFKTLTYFEGKYEDLDIEPQNILKACSNDYFWGAYFFKVNREASMVYLKEELIERLKRYVESQYDFSLNAKYNKFDPNQLCNRLACESFPDYVEETALSKGYIYPVALYGFLEHKRCMGWRLKYILKKEGKEDELINEYEAISNNYFELGMNLGLKYNICRKEDVLLKIKDILCILNKQELSSIIRLIDLLDNEK